MCSTTVNSALCFERQVTFLGISAEKVPIRGSGELPTSGPLKQLVGARKQQRQRKGSHYANIQANNCPPTLSSLGKEWRGVPDLKGFCQAKLLDLFIVNNRLLHNFSSTGLLSSYGWWGGGHKKDGSRITPWSQLR